MCRCAAPAHLQQMSLIALPPHLHPRRRDYAATTHLPTTTPVSDVWPKCVSDVWPRSGEPPLPALSRPLAILADAMES